MTGWPTVETEPVTAVFVWEAGHMWMMMVVVRPASIIGQSLSYG